MLIPDQILLDLVDMIPERDTNIDPRDVISGNTYRNSLIYSALASFVLGTMFSTMEIEKVVQGDPSLFKYKYSKTGTVVSGTVNVNGIEFQSDNVPVSILTDSFTDKIKRLGGVLSPGEEIMDQYGDNITDKYIELGSTKFSVLDMGDVKAISKYKKLYESMFLTQHIVETVRSDFFTDEMLNQVLSEINKKESLKKHNIDSKQKLINNIYMNEKVNKLVRNFIKKQNKELYQELETKAEISSENYNNINVADAQVILSPEMYRRLRIGFGDWSFTTSQIVGMNDREYVQHLIEHPEEIDESDISDELAHNILEQRSDWMDDDNLSKVVSRFQAYVLKMSYYSKNTEKLADKTSENDSDKQGIYINRQIYNKMAMFPLYKYMTAYTIGQQLYDRMNGDPQNKIDMLAFESAVKVGGTKFKLGSSAVCF